MDEPEASDLPTPCRVGVQHLTLEQVALLRSVLRAGEVPFGIVRGEVLAPGEFAEEVQKAVEWASLDTHAIADAEFDDPEYFSDRAPLVQPPRPPLRDGRRQATRWRRLCAGVLDEVIVGVPTLLAHKAGAAPWTGAAIHAMYYVAPTALWGWSVGKLWCGLRVVSRRTLHTPNPLAVLVRWLVAASPLLVGLFVPMNGDLVGFIITLVYAPILFTLRGLHDMAAGTVVVEQFAGGPGIWVRERDERFLSERR
jgi:uncharacterized RDD family membrane protein YckC